MVENSQPRQTDLVIQNTHVAKYRQDLLSYRHAFAKANGVLKKFNTISQERKAFDQLRHEASVEKDVDVTAVQSWKQEISKRESELGGKPAKIKATEERRLAINNLIRIKNNLKVKLAIERGEIPPTAANLIGLPQIPYDSPNISVSIPESPVLPHNDLNNASIYGKKQLTSKLETAVKMQSGTRTIEQKATALGLLLPKDGTELGFSILKDKRYVAEELIKLSQEIDDLAAGKIIPPSKQELGKRGPDQVKHVSTAVSVILLRCLGEEITDPNKSDSELRKHYQSRINNELREMADWIGGRIGYEMVSGAIENLPDIKYAMLASRLSSNLDRDLGFAGANCASERKLAELLRSAAYASREPQGIKSINFSQRNLIDKLVETINERVESGEISIYGIFTQLEELDYGENVIIRLIDRSDFECKGIILRLLHESGCFEDLCKSLKNEDFNFSTDEDDSSILENFFYVTEQP